MKTNYELRYAAHPEDAKQYDTKRILSLIHISEPTRP